MSDLKTHTGTVTSVVGGVVEAHFGDELPSVKKPFGTGSEESPAFAEVALHLGNGFLRGKTLNPTCGPAIGQELRDTGKPLQAPDGEQALGRVFNVFGKTIARWPLPGRRRALPGRGEVCGKSVRFEWS